MKKNRFDRNIFYHRIRSALLAAGIAASVSMTACGGNAAFSTADYIGIDGAKEAALKAAELSSDDVDFVSAGLDNKNGTFYYQVVFTEQNMEHQYDIDALTGVVIEESHLPQTDETAVSSSQAYGNQTDGEPVQETGGLPAEDSGDRAAALQAAEPAASQGIDSDTALALALSHAGVTEEDLRFHRVKAKTDDGRRVYDVEFISSNGTEYDYKLSAEDGSIVSYDYDAESSFRQPPSAYSSMIPESQAKQAVLDRVPGARAEDVRLKLEEDDGRMEYEGKLIYDNMEYEFKIDAYSGGLIEWEAEVIRR
ncbi:MAG: PepSY domain-containing protein [Lachnospiraceae bacterium]|nr:PepSY domain-containing protein [Lachnospiraceae bacterium]